MSDLRQEKSLAYISSLQLNPKTSNATKATHLTQNDQLAAYMFANQDSKRLITVSASGEFSLPPDRVKMTVIIRSLKSSIDEAKHSVARRLEYVHQTLKNNGLKENDVNISKIYNRKDNLYEALCEITAFMSDFNKYQQIHNLFVEKLDETVKILQPELSHTSLRLENLKRQASIQALRNAKHVAFDLAKNVGLTLGKPMSIIEENTREIEGLHTGDRQPDPQLSKTFQEILSEKTITIIVNLSISFELKLKGKSRKENL